MSRLLTSCMLVALFPIAARAQVSLAYTPELKTGQVIRTEVDLATNQTLTIAGMPLESVNNSFMVTRETVGDTTPEGGQIIQGEFEIVQSDMSLPGGIKFSFNSNNPNQEQSGEVQEMIGGFLRATAAAKWKVKTDAHHKVISAEYLDAPFANVSEYFKSDTSPEVLKKRADTELARYPSEPVKTGDTWKRTESFEAGGGQTLEFDREFTLLGTEDRNGRLFAKVGVKTLTAKLTVADNAAVPLKVTESDLKIADADGTVWYDQQAKAFTEGQEKVHITGTLTLEVNGMKLPGELDLTIESKSKTSLIEK